MCMANKSHSPAHGPSVNIYFVNSYKSFNNCVLCFRYIFLSSWLTANDKISFPVARTPLFLIWNQHTNHVKSVNWYTGTENIFKKKNARTTCLVVQMAKCIILILKKQVRRVPTIITSHFYTVQLIITQTNYYVKRTNDLPFDWRKIRVKLLHSVLILYRHFIRFTIF